MKEKINRMLGLALCLLIMSGCSVQLVSKYDQQTVVQLTQLDCQIETMYRQMLMVNTDQRHYVNYADIYTKIDISLRSLQRHEDRRKNNEETIKQIKILLNLWNQDKQTHKEKDSISDFLINRHMVQYRRLFDTIINGEMAKKQE